MTEGIENKMEMEIKVNDPGNEGKTTTGIYIKGSDIKITSEQELILNYGEKPTKNHSIGITDIKDDTPGDDRRRCCHWFLTLLLMTALGYAVYAIINLAVIGITIALFGFVLLYMIYLVNTLKHSNTAKYLNTKKSTTDIIQYMDTLKNKKPSILFHGHAYHMETAEHSYTDSDGNTQWEKSTYSVTTYKGSQEFNFTSWNDGSPTLNISSNMAKIKFDKIFTLGDEKTQHLYHEQKRIFDSKNRKKDKRYRSWVTYNISGFQGRFIYISIILILYICTLICAEQCLATNGEISKCISIQWFCVFAIFGCGSCYRAWFGTKAKTKKTYSINTIIYKE